MSLLSMMMGARHLSAEPNCTCQRRNPHLAQAAQTEHAQYHARLFAATNCPNCPKPTFLPRTSSATI